MLDSRLLQCFVEVAERLSYTRAAERLNCTQSWLSRQIVKLEQQLGFRLFERTSRTVVLSERGRELLERAQAAVDHIKGVESLAGRLAHPEPTLTLGVPTYALMVEQRLALCDRFLKEHPKVRVETRIDAFRHLDASLRDGEIDAAFGIHPRGAAGSEDASGSIDTLVIARSGLDLVYPAESGGNWEGEGPITPESLSGQRVAAFSRRANRDLFDVIFGQAEKCGAQMVEFSDFSFHRHLDQVGAVTLLPGWQSLPAPGLARRPIAGTEDSIALVCMRLKSQRLRALDAFWTLARAQVV